MVHLTIQGTDITIGQLVILIAKLISCRFSGNYGSVGKSGGGGMASMMDEMQKTLARRRAKVDRGSEEPDSDRNDSGARMEKGGSPGKPLSQSGSQAGSESPKPGRRRHSTRGSICGPEVDIMSSSLNAGGGESRVWIYPVHLLLHTSTL